MGEAAFPELNVPRASTVGAGVRHKSKVSEAGRPVAVAFSRQLLLGLLGGTLLMIATLFMAWWMAGQQDAAVRESSRRMVAGGVDTLVERTQAMLLDYAIWTSAFDRITAGDLDWMASNIGASVDIGTFDMAVVVPPRGAALIGWSAGAGPAPAADLLEPAALAAAAGLLDADPIDSGEARITYVRSGGAVWLIAAAHVVPQEGVPNSLTRTDTPGLILAIRVSTETMAEIARRFDIKALAVVAAPAPDREALPLMGAGDQPVAWVTWTAPTPGRSVLEAALGPLIALMVAVGAVALLVSRELVRSACRLEGALDQARTADRMKTEFLGNVSHELRTPLNGVIGIAQLLQMREREPESREMLDLLLASARSQLQLVNGLLDITRIETGSVTLDRVPFDPAAALEETLSLIGPDVRTKRLSLDVSIAPATRRPVLGDMLAFQQVATNLVGNALKFTDSGQIAVSLQPSEEGLLLAVADTGVGIDPAEHERIFERFVQVDASVTRRVGGAGLGLAITRALVELMQGRIAVTSALGRGSCFTVVLPLPPADSLASAA